MYKTQLIGNIGRDAIVTQLGENSAINFTVAVTEKWLDKDKVKHEKTIWFDCALFRQSTTIANYLKKGQLIFLSGKIELKQWQSAGGEHKAGLGMIVDEIELLGGKIEPTGK